MANKTWLATADGNWSTTGNWSGGTPVAGDNVFIPAGTPAITTGLNQSAVALATVYFQAGFTKAVGTAAAYLQLNCTALLFAGSGQAYIDVGASAITPSVSATAAGSATIAGLYLKGSALTSLAIGGTSCNVALAGQVGETSTVGIVRNNGKSSQVFLGSGVTVTTINISNGTLTANCAFTTANVYGGTFNHTGTGAGGTVNTFGGNSNLYSTGTITNNNMNGGKTDTLGLGLPRTHTNVKLNPDAQFSYDPAVLTIANWIAADMPVKLTAAAA